jgi:hypothetical protein
VLAWERQTLIGGRQGFRCSSLSRERRLRAHEAHQTSNVRDSCSRNKWLQWDPRPSSDYFKQLDSEGRLLPTLDDYTALENDRGRRFVEHVTRVIPRLMEQARDQPEVEQSTSIGGSAEIGVAMEVVETLEDV